MTSAAARLSSCATAIVDSPEVGSRLALKPNEAAKGFFDGGWWPLSRDPVREFSALVSALEPQFGPVDRIGFSRTSWDTAPRRLLVGDHTIKLAAFQSLNQHTVVVIGPRLHHLTLLLVPPGASPDAAWRALATAAAKDNIADAAWILATSSVG